MVSARRRREAIPGLGEKAVSLQFPVYIHRDRLTAAEDEGVEAATVHLIVVLSRRQDSYRVDCLDMEEVYALMPRSMRQSRDCSLVPVITAAMEALKESGVNPDKVQGWGRWFKGSDIQRARREVGC